MDVSGRVAVVTGGADGIGRALAGALVAAGAKVLIADLDGGMAARVAEELGSDAIATAADVTVGEQIESCLAQAEERFGPVDLYLANAGVIGGDGLSTEADWARTVDVNLMAHVRAARLLVPRWRERGEGYFVAVASAAGLLTQIGQAPYAVSKHAAVAFAEWLAVTHGSAGVKVSCVCPLGVDTEMLSAGLAAGGARGAGARAAVAAGQVVTPQRVAEVVLEAVAAERFLVLPQPEVLEYFAGKGRDYDRWLAGMRRLHGGASPEDGRGEG